jgi:hypothetical protein
MSCEEHDRARELLNQLGVPTAGLTDAEIEAASVDLVKRIAKAFAPLLEKLRKWARSTSEALSEIARQWPDGQP